VSSIVSGVYVFASLNETTNTWDALAYIVVGPLPTIETYTDGSLSTKTQTYTTNSSGAVTVYVAATVLDTTDTYMVGIEDQLTGQCVFTTPSSTQTSNTTAPYKLCNLTTTAATGAVPNANGLVLANWAVQLGSGTTIPQGGTYMATIFDQKTGVRVATRLFTVIDGRSTGSTARVNLSFISNQGTITGASRVAWNGTATNVQDGNFTTMGIGFGVTGLPANGTDNYTLVLTDPTGTVAKEYTGVKETSSTTIVANASPNPNAGPATWTLPTESIPFEQAFPGSTWTATVYDATSSKLVAEQSFQILGYSTEFNWTQPTDSTTLDITSGTSQATTLLITNTSDLTFGSNDGDPGINYILAVPNTCYYSSTAPCTGNKGPGVTDVLLQGPSASTACDTVSSGTCTAVYSDSAGNAWSCAASFEGVSPYFAIFFLNCTPVTAGQALKPGSSLNVTGLTIQATGCTNSACQFNTEEVPQDSTNTGIDSAYGTVSNYVYVINGSGSVAGTGTIGLAGYYNGSTYDTIQDLYTPRCSSNNSNCTSAGVAQSIFAINQPFTSATNTVVLAYTLKNISTSAAIQVFDLSPPAGFTLSSAAIDSHTPNGATITANGTCNGQARVTICITPTTPIPAGSSQTFYIDLTPPTQAFSYSDVIGTILLSSASTSSVAISITPTTNSVATFIGSPTTVDSTAIGAYSLNGGLMTAGFSPSSVGTSTSNSLTFSLRNTTAAADPFPDEVDFVALQIPNNTVFTAPTSCNNITVNTSGWNCDLVTSGSGQPTTIYFGQCPQQVSTTPTLPATSTSLGSDNLTVCPFALPNEPYSLAAGGTFSASIPITAGTSTGSVTVSSYAHGATTDAWSTPITSTLAATAGASAGSGFTSVSVPGPAASTVTTGSEPTETGDFYGSPPSYDNFVYKITNTGSVNITTATITIPGPDTTGSNGTDTSGNYWQLTAAPTLNLERTSNANGCTDTYTNPTSGAVNGSIVITCPAGDFLAGDVLDVSFSAIVPLKVNSSFAWPATINSGPAVATTSSWPDDQDILIALAATVSVSLNTPTPGTTCGGTASPGMGYPNISVATTFNFGAVGTNTYEWCKDAMTVQVTTDASNPTNWSLYASASANPSATSGTAATTAASGSGTESTSNELLVATDPSTSTGGTTTVPKATAGCLASATPITSACIPCPSGSSATSCFSYDNTTFTPIQLTSNGTGTRLGYTTNGGSGVNNSTVTTNVSYEVAVGAESVPPTGYQETITYTWIAN